MGRLESWPQPRGVSEGRTFLARNVPTIIPFCHDDLNLKIRVPKVWTEAPAVAKSHGKRIALRDSPWVYVSSRDLSRLASKRTGSRRRSVRH